MVHGQCCVVQASILLSPSRMVDWQVLRPWSFPPNVAPIPQFVEIRVLAPPSRHLLRLGGRRLLPPQMIDLYPPQSPQCLMQLPFPFLDELGPTGGLGRFPEVTMWRNSAGCWRKTSSQRMTIWWLVLEILFSIFCSAHQTRSTTRTPPAMTPNPKYHSRSNQHLVTRCHPSTMMWLRLPVPYFHQPQIVKRAHQSDVVCAILHPKTVLLITLFLKPRFKRVKL